MPYTKTIRPYSQTRRLLLGYELTAAPLAKVLGCSVPTARKKLNSPGQLTADDWEKINTKGHVPLEEIREAFLR